MPEGLKQKANGLVQNVRDIIPALPMVMINLILAMINVIYSKLKIITSIIPLGSLYPLNLIPTAITATPMIMSMMYTLPGYVQSMVEGMVRQKIAEAMAMKIPQVTIDPALLESLGADIWDNEMTKRASTKKALTYKDVVEEFCESQGYQMGYTKNQIKEVLKNYLAIRDGTSLMLTEYEDDGPQNLAALGLAA